MYTLIRDENCPDIIKNGLLKDVKGALTLSDIEATLVYYNALAEQDMHYRRHFLHSTDASDYPYPGTFSRAEWMRMFAKV